MSAQEITEKKEEKQILVFCLLNEELGLDISCVREVLKPQEIHPLPQAPDFIEGVINLRGRIIAVIDLRKKFNIKAIEDRPKMRIIICKINPVRSRTRTQESATSNGVKKFIVGLIVDSVSEVINLSEKDIQSTPEIVSMQIEDGYVEGIARVGERVITLLNLEEILTKDDIKTLMAANEKDANDR